VQRYPRAFWRLNKRTRWIVGTAAGAVLLVLLWLIFGSGSGGRKAPVPTVIVATATSKAVTVVEHTMGTVVANAPCK